MEAPEHSQSDQSVQSGGCVSLISRPAIVQSYKRAQEIGLVEVDDDRARGRRSGGKTSFCVHCGQGTTVIQSGRCHPEHRDAGRIYIYVSVYNRVPVPPNGTTRAWNVAINTAKWPEWFLGAPPSGLICWAAAREVEGPESYANKFSHPGGYYV